MHDQSPDGEVITTRCNLLQNWVTQCYQYLEISALIDGRHLDLEGGKTKEGLLALGEYRARLATDEHEKLYFSKQEYEFQYPDGATQKFAVTGESK
jgi:hypothetical protein